MQHWNVFLRISYPPFLLLLVSLIPKTEWDHYTYYATFKVRKFKLLLYKINACLQKTTTCIGLEAEQIFLVNIYMGPLPFFILNGAFTVPFLFCFQKLQLLDVKKF